MVDAILQASARVLLERGYVGMNTNFVAQQAGVSVGSLYQYFPNKESLLTALHNRHAQQMAQSIENILTEPGELGLRGEVVRLVRAAMAAHEVEPDLHRQLEKERPFFEGLPDDGGLGGEIHRHIQRLLEKYSEDISHSDMALAAWMTMRMTESLVHTTVLHPPKGGMKKYTEQAKLAAVQDYCSGNGGLRDVARRHNVNFSSLRQWVGLPDARYHGQLLKRERIKRKIYTTRQDAWDDVFDYIEMFYNPKRRHSFNNQLSPVEFEKRYVASLESV